MRNWWRWRIAAPGSSRSHYAPLLEARYKLGLPPGAMAEMQQQLLEAIRSKRPA